MSLALPCIRPDRPATRLPVLRWTVLAVTLALEVLAVTVRYDTGSLDGEPGPWAALVGELHHLPHVAIAVVVAFAALGGRRLREELISSADRVEEVSVVRWYVAAHVAIYAAFFAVTAQLLERPVHSPGERGLWAAGWFVLGFTSTLLLALAALPLTLWFRLGRRLAVPLLLSAALGVAAWVGGRFTDRLWLVLADSTFWIVRRLLGILTSDLVCDPAQCVIGTSTFQIEISPECSGYEGMGLMWVFLAGYLWLARGGLRFPQAWLLLPLGTVTIYLANAVRIAALVAVGTWGSPEVALGGFHSQAGWLAFNAVALGLIVGARRVRFFSRSADEPVTSSPAAAYLVPLLVLVASVMITTALSTGFDWLYPVRVVAVSAVLVSYRRVYARLGWRLSWEAVAVGAGVFVLWMLLEPLAGAAAGNAGLPAGVARGWWTLWLAFRMFGSVVTVPLAEELAFRGYLLRRLQGRVFEEIPSGRFTWFSFLASSVLFGVLHERWLAGSLAGMAYAGILYRRGRLADAIVAHAVTNGLIAAYVLMTGTWSLWS